MNVRLCCAIVALGTLAACQTNMVIPDSLKDDSVRVPLEIERDASGPRVIRFEGYTVEIIDDGDIVSASPEGVSTVGTSYGFKMKRSKGGVVQATCSTRQQVHKDQVGKLGIKIEEIDQTLVCDLGGPAQGQFIIGSKRDQHYLGAITFGDESLQLSSNHRLEEMIFDSPTPVGFTLTQDQEIVAVIQTVNGPTLTVASRQSDETWDMIAVVTAVVMIDQELRKR